ncbi:MAG: ribokinase [Aquiluna sp.]|nr:ribokinase [Aquiluna sp.]
MVDQDPIVVIGSANCDYAVFMHELPKPGETVLASGAARFAGGKGLNQATAAHRAAGEVRFQFAHGDDDEGNFLTEFLGKQGMVHVPVLDLHLPTGRAYIFVDEEGENQIVVVPGANRSRKLKDVVFEPGPGFLVLQLEIGNDNNLFLAEQAKGAGWTVVLTPAPSSEFDSGLLSKVDILTLNESEALQIGGGSDFMTSGKNLSQKVQSVYLTRGSKGVSVFEAGELIGHVDAMAVSALDATGAGDTFCGYLVAGLSQGLLPMEAAKLATIAAGLAVQAMGASESVPFRSQVDSVLDKD